MAQYGPALDANLSADGFQVRHCQLQIDGVVIDDWGNGSAGPAQVHQDRAIALAEFLSQRLHIVAIEPWSTGKNDNRGAGTIHTVVNREPAVQDLAFLAFLHREAHCKPGQRKPAKDPPRGHTAPRK